MKNPVSNETSESVINPVPVVSISITVAVSIVVVVATIYSWTQYIDWTSIRVIAVIVLVVTLVAVIVLIIGIMQGDRYYWISLLVPVVIVSVVTLVPVIFFIRVTRRITRYDKERWRRTRKFWISYLVPLGVVLVVTLVAPISLIIGITQADQYNWTSILVPVVIASVVALVAEIFLLIREMWLIIRYELWQKIRYDWISIRVPVGVVLVVVLVALISVIIGRGQGDQFIWISILVQAGGRLVVALVAEIFLLIMARRHRAQNRPEHEMVPLNPPPDGEGQPNTTQHPSNGAGTQRTIPVSATQNSLRGAENSVKMPEEKPETNCEPSADEQEADDRGDKPQNTLIKTSVGESSPFEDVTVTTGQNVT